MNGFAKQRDANERLIVDALRAVGATVQRLNEKGTPDLLVGFRGVNYLLEVKNPESKFSIRGGRRTRGRGTLRATQVEWFAAWKGAPVVEVINGIEALVAIGALAADGSVADEQLRRDAVEVARARAARRTV